ncbi:hypothetical protein CEUSTIGMA_g5393.t1 [Chlamydomonas eustigma]|uniref:Gamma-glutamylcyclotransferase AIG2-like domain-containing protein n=1 Tax=Chlamydomonas eustigma TaxID=1157962 RepID=A0A250X4G1_9CHLO|nr:hypothetical protein CEUSTIGMA_g5393.t1 [Chlamydomonas eustigma]|eukprot:GAX77951.1 hypothetical protein CEUSTIGMA_g5393.t1 [Chlamydomonas eustigma]
MKSAARANEHLAGAMVVPLSALSTRMMSSWNFLLRFLTQLRERLGRSSAFEFRPAYLQDHVRIFAGHSKRWDGAVASVHPLPGCSVEGMVVGLTADELEVLDTYEKAYTRVRRPVHPLEIQNGGISPVLPEGKTPHQLPVPPAIDSGYDGSHSHLFPEEGAFVYIKDSTEYQQPPSKGYLTAICIMLKEAGHKCEVVIRYVDEGMVKSDITWTPDSS